MSLHSESITTMIDKKILMYIITCSTSKEMFNKQCSIYERDVDQFMLAESFHTFPYDSANDISYNISVIEILSFKLNALNQKLVTK